MERTKRNFARFTTFYFVVISTPGQNNVFSKPNERKRIINWIYYENCRNFTNSTHSDFSLTNSHKVQTQLTNWKIKKKRWKNRKIMSPKNLRTVAREGHHSQHASSSLKFIGTIVGLSATPKKFWDIFPLNWTNSIIKFLIFSWEKCQPPYIRPHVMLAYIE